MPAWGGDVRVPVAVPAQSAIGLALLVDFRRIRRTAATNPRAPDHYSACVAASGVSCKVLCTTRSITSALSGGLRPGSRIAAQSGDV